MLTEVHALEHVGYLKKNRCMHELKDCCDLPIHAAFYTCLIEYYSDSMSCNIMLYSLCFSSISRQYKQCKKYSNKYSKYIFWWG